MLWKRTHTYLPAGSCCAIRCTGLPTPTNTPPSKPRSPKKDTCDQPSLANHIMHFPSCSGKPFKNIFCTAKFCVADCKKIQRPYPMKSTPPPNSPSPKTGISNCTTPSKPDIECHTQHVSSHSPPCHNPVTPTERTRKGSIPTVTHLPHGT